MHFPVRGAGRKTLRDRILSRPLVSPPPRLRRLGVRQVDDSKSVSSPTTTECSYEPSEENNRKRMAKSEAMVREQLIYSQLLYFVVYCIMTGVF